MAGKQIFSCLRRPTSICTSSSFAPQVRSASRSALTATRRLQEERSEEARAMERNFTRDWKAGDVYAPHDLSAAEARKWKSKKAPTTDAFDVLSLNPLNLYKNFSVMSEYVTDMGRIKPRSQTGLRPVNQRRVAKAIRRAIALGLMPSVYRHPELLKIEKKRAGAYDFYM
ncbi:hypothetical protein H2198_008266 [Neophaeococcomyces mojaviensis]|uniref:Uncharacterized protein n=1 Tax=Neophaeococcomyces mojaviensis TaxID=3383035 RepID=A0ACC2ZXT9_9EURO|nr:hypothetical protein H2198_008266 [Knufia sp. JES_112]